MARILAVSPLGATVRDGDGDDDDDVSPLWVVELRDLARGFCGALFLAMPLLYTLEMWERARAIPAWDIALIVILTYFGNVGFALFNGFKNRPGRRTAWLDALTAMGIGLVASAITLVLIARVTLGLPHTTVARLLLLEMVPASFGASLAVNQLGGDRRSRALRDDYSPDVRKLLATTLGALMFSFNIAPTVETQIIGNAMSWWHTTGVVLFSVAVSYLMVFIANFADSHPDGGVLRSRWVETLVAYIVSLAVSAALLWMFGYVDLTTPLHLAVPWVVVMGYATTLAGAAGRLIV